MCGSEPTRILFLNHWARRLGGAEHSLLDILAETARRAEVHLVTSEPGELVDRAARLGVITHIVHCSPLVGQIRRGNLLMSATRCWGAVPSYCVFVVRMARLVRALHPDVVHANVPKSHIALALLVLMGFRRQTVFHIREIFDHGSIAYRLYAMLVPRRARVIAISSAVKCSLPRRLAPLAKVIHNGVEIPAEPASVGTGSVRRFLYLGRVVPWKGCDLLIEAFARVVGARGPSAASLTITGDTLYWDQSYRERLMALVSERGLGSCCSLQPHTAQPFMAMAAHDIFCIGSDREPFGRVAAEAQAVGLPVIGFRSGGLPEVVEENQTGLLVPFGDVEAFALAMTTMVDQPELVTNMGRKARERAGRLFDRSIQIPRVVDAIMG